MDETVKPNLAEIKKKVDDTIQTSVKLALEITETEKDEDKRNLIIAGAQAKGLSNAIEYLYTVIDSLL